MSTCGRCNTLYDGSEQNRCPKCGSNIVRIVKSRFVNCTNCDTSNPRINQRCLECGEILPS